MLGVLVAALVGPAPSPTPLKTITNVRSTPFCTTLRENVARAIKALIDNNVTIGQSKSLFLRMAHDKVSSTRPSTVMDLDVQRLGPLIDAMAQNLIASQAALNDGRHFAERPKTDDDRRLAEIRNELRAIVERQNEALNILSGMYYSYNGNRLLRNDGLPKGSEEPETPIVLPPIRPPASALPSPAGSPSPGATPDAVDLGLIGATKFAGLFNDLTTYQIDELPLEAQAAKTVLQSAAECRS